MTSLWQDFLNNNGVLIEKWAHYFPIYERHFSSWQNRTLTFWEIGVNTGGSIKMWQRYFGPMARIVGIDINPECRKLNGTPGLHVRIGDQANTTFLKEVIDEFGVPDIILDDGSHRSEDVWASFSFVYPQMGKNGIYMVEDMHASYMQEYGGSVDDPNTFVNKSKVLVDQLNAHVTYQTGIKQNPMMKGTTSICFYDGVVLFEKGEIYRNAYVGTGS